MNIKFFKKSKLSIIDEEDLIQLIQ